jgi:hypothetical protein
VLIIIAVAIFRVNVMGRGRSYYINLTVSTELKVKLRLDEVGCNHMVSEKK